MKMIDKENLKKKNEFTAGILNLNDDTFNIANELSNIFFKV